jgi:hypothetical protein
MSQTTPVVSYGTTAPPAPDKAMGVFKMVIGLALAAAGTYLFFYNVDRELQKTSGDTGTGVFLGVIAGLGLWLLVNGVIQVRGRHPKLVVGIGVLVLTIVAFALVFPRAAQGARRAMEQQYWDRLQASKKTYKDYKDYLEYNPLPRKGMFAEAAAVGVKEEMAKTGAEAEGRVARLRSLIYDFNKQMKERNEPEIKASITAAHDGLAQSYAKAREDLAERLEKSATRTEFPEDPKMRAAFAQVLDRVARQDQNFVYLAFASEDLVTKSVPGAGAPGRAKDLIEPGEAFGPAQDGKRQDAFESALEGSLRTAFKEPLIEIIPLRPGDSRDGKVVFDVRCVTKPAPGTMKLTLNGKSVGTLFKIEVAWQFTIVDVDGKPLVKHTTVSYPANSFGFNSQSSDPTWAPYSVMMDSTYHNFCREVTGRLGLIPPKVKEDFSFRR